ncbi:archaemetzincin-2 [Crotalus adamanteus]|uniref:Archaemetzincin-2 n=1 Tax=Crotalus adamanteus TaxID=8729 RepID=A0AAW1BYY7_CROAD
MPTEHAIMLCYGPQNTSAVMPQFSSNMSNVTVADKATQTGTLKYPAASRLRLYGTQRRRRDSPTSRVGSASPEVSPREPSHVVWRQRSANLLPLRLRGGGRDRWPSNGGMEAVGRPMHEEPTQDFSQFYHDPCRNLPTRQKRKIYIQPIGSFGDAKVSTDVYLKWLRDYCEAFYYNLTVRILDPMPVSHTGCAFRINEYTQNLQIHAGYLLNYLKKKKPKDAFCIVGITMIDLYPKDSWNFVFGQASLTEGVGIFSFARYDSDFYSANYKGRLKTTKKLPAADYSVFDGYYTPEITSKLLLRSCKTLTHEIGHIFGLHHCQWLECVMQGSNHLEESDRRPLDLCPICLRKLQSVLGFSILERYKALQRWIEDKASGTDEGHSSEARGGLPKPVFGVLYADGIPKIYSSAPSGGIGSAPPDWFRPKERGGAKPRLIFAVNLGTWSPAVAGCVSCADVRASNHAKLGEASLRPQQGPEPQKSCNPRAERPLVWGGRVGELAVFGTLPRARRLQQRFQLWLRRMRCSCIGPAS